MNTTTTNSGAPVSMTLAQPPLEDGYQRMAPPPIAVASGFNGDWIQWVSDPLDQDYDVISIKGKQSVGGHHAVLLSTSEPNPKGFTRKYTERDQLTSSSLGGIGAEGNVAIPEGLVFRVRKGRSLAIQVHYLNSSDAEINAETYIDVMMTPRDESHVVAGHFNSATLKFSVAPKAETVSDFYCDTGEDLEILRATNHMHDSGTSVFTEYTDPAGMTHMIKQDDAWSYDWALQPNYKFYPKEAPLIIPKGSRLHTHCVWNNGMDQARTFPDEMCAFATVILGEREINCIDNVFSVSALEVAGAAAGAAAPPPNAAAAGAPAAGSGAMADGGACTGSADKAIVEGAEFEATARTCGSMCLGAPEACATNCLTMNTTLSPGCAGCQGTRLSCAMVNCIGDCAGGFMSAPCKSCLATHCDTAYRACSGL